MPKSGVSFSVLLFSTRQTSTPTFEPTSAPHLNSIRAAASLAALSSSGGVEGKGKIQGQGDRSTIASCHCVSGLTRAYSSEVRLFDRERHNCRDAAAPLPPTLVVSIISNRALNDWRSQVRYISGNLKLLEIHIIWDPPLLRDRRIILPFFSLRYFTGSVARVASRESFCILYREPRKCRAIERDQPTISLLCLAGLVA